MAKYSFKTAPRKYQREALIRAVREEQFGLFMPMRSGKTKVAVDWANVLHVKHGIRRVLVVTHTPTTFGVWRTEFHKHSPLNVTTYYREPGEDYSADLEVLIINIQSVWARERVGKRGFQPAPNKMLYAWDPQAIIVDEATCIGDPSSVQTAHLWRLQHQLGVRFKLILTGTPLHRNMLKSFGMFKFLDDSIFGTSYGAFKMQYGVWGGHMGKKLLDYRNVKNFRRRIKPHVYQMKRVPMRPPVHQVIPLELSREERELYDRMAKESIVQIGKKYVEAPIVLTKLLKMAQIAGGHLKDEDGRWHRVGTTVGDAYQEVLHDLEESEVKRVVVFARHIPELRDAAIRAKAAGYKTILLHGGIPAEGRERRIAAFHDPGGYKVFISQISTGSMGIDLSCADTAIYYSLTESLLHKDQADARIYQHGSSRPLTYYYLLPRRTVLEDMYMALRAKMDLVRYVMDHPDLVSYQVRV